MILRLISNLCNLHCNEFLKTKLLLYNEHLKVDIRFFFIAVSRLESEL